MPRGKLAPLVVIDADVGDLAQGAVGIVEHQGNLVFLADQFHLLVKHAKEDCALGIPGAQAAGHIPEIEHGIDHGAESRLLQILGHVADDGAVIRVHQAVALAPDDQHDDARCFG
ncbi:hypothetical protein SDC9_124644 [bioreactor metagenome]|uniref:Uncharacterized protein n=1 Tax=bioreactor metagenome TaxID=1076179 RepID=A0A645CL28_9ZZZZ